MTVSSSIRVVIVDDEPLAREGVRVQLAQYPEVHVVGECGDGPEAIRAIEQLTPDLLFLDVQMPGMDGFEVLRTLELDKFPVVVFITAYDQHALKAFEVSAIDFLLKPFDDERFQKAFDRAKNQIEIASIRSIDQHLHKLLAAARSDEHYVERMVVKSFGRIFFLPTSEIDWIEAADNYVSLHTGAHAHLVRDTLTALEAKLDPRHFLRIRSSAIVNIDRIKELHPLFKGDFEVLLKSGAKLRTSRRYRERLSRLLDGKLSEKP
jgi:two-component system, LytTR family, response regulator